MSMIMEAIIKISGKQYRVSEGQRVTIDRLQNAVGEEVTFDQVLMLADGAAATVGTPTVDGAAVTARVVSAARGPKIVVYKYKPKKRFRRTQGFRAAQSVVEVLAVTGSGGGKARVPATKTAAKAKTAEAGGAAAKPAAPAAAAKPAAKTRPADAGGKSKAAADKPSPAAKPKAKGASEDKG
jgi:large subunit ribosomal protein L21